MTLEKPEGSLPEESGQNAPGDPGGGKKPVLVYIMVLFIAAFLLMALSFMAHQRSNTRALGQLQNSVSAMRDVQDLQKQVIDLQNELNEAQAAADAFQDANEASRNQVSHLEHLLERTREIAEQFWQLEEAYREEDFPRCRSILEAMEQNSEDPPEQYLTQAMAERYQEIAAAIRKGEYSQLT